jgi:hypothetical protein
MSAARTLPKALLASRLTSRLLFAPPRAAFTTSFNNNINNHNITNTKRNFSSTMSTSTGVHNLTT